MDNTETSSEGPRDKASPLFRTTLAARRWLSKKTFEIALRRPAPFRFEPGQTIRIAFEGLERDYSPVSAPGEAVIRLCIRHVRDGKLTPFLAETGEGTPLEFSGPHGYFTFRQTARPPVFVATGTGIAPFVSMAASGISGFTLLHGVRHPDELYYRPELVAAAENYVPCLSGKNTGGCPGAFQGKVTRYVESRLDRKPYDFYLCGREDMIRDMTHLIDDLFPGSRLFIEIFY